MSATATLPRREFLSVVAVAGSGLVVGVFVPTRGRAQGAQDARFAPNAFVRVAEDGTVSIISGYSEMGQGILTSIAMLVAEELEVDPTTVKYELAPAAPAYMNPLFGMQGTGGSTTTRATWEGMRRAGATAREMLLSAAAAQWGVSQSDLVAANGNVSHAAGNRTIGYGALAHAAATQTVPQNVPLKPSSAWKVLGRRVKRLDSLPKVTGRAGFGLDVHVPGMLIAVIARSPVFGVTMDEAAAARMAPVLARQARVRHVVPVPGGFAVVANNYWAAKQGRDRLTIAWPASPNDHSSSDTIRARWAELARQGTGAVMVRHEGQGPAALAGAARRLDVVYEVPYLAHACMEPMNCTAHVTPGSVEIWAPTQAQTITKSVAAQIAGVPESAVQVHTTLLGGGFGRRFEVDFVMDAVRVSKAVGAPVKLVYSREDDIQHDMYRPAVYNVLAAGLDASGAPIAWTHRSVSSSIIARVFPQMFRDGKDESAYEGAADLPYAIPNIHVDWVRDEPGVPVGFWRSVGNSHTAWVKESFIDEIAAASQTDPLELRRRLLSASSAHSAPRLLGVLNLAAERAGWGTPPPAGTGRGIAVHESFGSFVAEVAEVRMNGDGTPKVTRVVVAIDCGQIVNPLTIEAQMQGCVVYGLSAALHGAITIENGRVVQSNFHDYTPLRLDEMPRVEVHILPSTENPGGVGEPGTPPIAPAVCNALFALTGKRIRRLPIRAEDLRS
jgi:isoquinoline 1-oxidoreductase beta subunit